MTTWTDQEWFGRTIEHQLAEEGFGTAGLLFRGWCNGKPEFYNDNVDWEQVQRIAIGEDVPETDFGNIEETPSEPDKPRRGRRRK